MGYLSLFEMRCQKDIGHAIMRFFPRRIVCVELLATLAGAMLYRF